MNFQGLTSQQATAAWSPFLALLKANSAEWKILQPFVALAAPARHFWDADLLFKAIPHELKLNDGPGARPGDYWWTGDGDQVGAFWTGYASVWLPVSLLSEGVTRLAKAWAEASRHRSVTLHFNKGLAGASPATIDASRDTAMNPQVLGAFALAIVGAAQNAAYPGWGEPDPNEGKRAAAAVHAADQALRMAAPGAGSYLSECDYFLPDWKRASWGRHSTRLEAIKRRYDPDGLFVVHHGIGSDNWSSDGFTPV